MTDQVPEVLSEPDHYLVAGQTISMAHVPVTEVTQMHIYHHPDNKADVNGFTFVVRDAEGSHTICLREGLNGNGIEPVPATPYETSGPEYTGLLESRGEQLEELQACIAKIGPLMRSLMADLKA